MHRPSLSHSIAAACTALLIASLAGCGETQPPPAAAPAVAASPQVPALEADPSAPDLVALGNAAFLADRLFDPPQDNAFNHFTAALAQDPDDAAAREALADIFPFALARVEAAIASGDRTEAGRLLDALDASFEDSPALAALRARLTATPPAPATVVPVAPAPPPEVPDPVPATPAIGEPPASATSEPLADPASSAQPEAFSAPTSESPEVTAAAVPEGASRTVATQRPPDSTPAADPPGVATTLTSTAPTTAALDRAARLVRRVAPDYPALARQRRIEGWVDLEYVVGIDGQVIDVRVLDSDPPRVFDVTAERALRRWQFEPASRGGIPTQSMGRTRIEFSPD